MGVGNVIRPAVIGDVPAMLRMGRDFMAELAPDLPFRAVYVDASIRGQVNDPARLSLVLDIDGQARGMLCAAKSQSPFAPILIAQELAFWIDPEFRGWWAGKLIDAYEDWARANGCARVALVDLSGRAGALYERLGYGPTETVYSKVI